MRRSPISIRLMEAEDFEAIVKIDERVLGRARADYYEVKFEKLFKSQEYLPTSLVAENEAGTIVGFVMGQLYMGEFGIFQEEASLDTIGVDPEFQTSGVGKKLVDAFMEHLRELGVKKVNTLVDQDHESLVHFFKENGFGDSSTINLERKL